MGKVFKRKDSPYYWLSYSRGGRLIRESSRTKSKGLAKSILEAKERHALLEPYSNPKKAIKGYLSEYLEWVRANRRKETIRSYGSVLRLFTDYLFQQARVTTLNAITPKTLEDYKMHRLAISKTNTVKNHIIVIKAFLNKAVEWEYLKVSPARYLRPIEITDAKPIHYLSEDEYRRFMDVCKSPKFEKYYPLFYVLVHTGMRSGEILNIEWEDINLKKKFIHVRSKEGFLPKGIDRSTGKAKDRKVFIHNGVVKVIDTIDRRRQKVFAVHKRPRRVMQRIAKEAGIKGLTRIHELRHSYASFLIAKGASVYVLKELLGHSDIKDTMRYVHLHTTQMKEGVKLLETLD